MESFFNLSFLKYPISLIFNMILVGFYLYIFPAKETKKVRENEFAAVNLEIPSADKKIEEKKSFGQNDVSENEDFTAAEVEKNEEIKLNNSRSDFQIRTSKPYAVKTIRSSKIVDRPFAKNTVKMSPKTYKTVSTYEKIAESDVIYQEKHGKIITKLEDRIKDLELRKRQSSEEKTVKIPTNINPKNDGFTFQDKDLIPKDKLENDSQNPILDNAKNRFFSNNKVKSYANTDGFTATNKGAKNQINNTLLKGRLLESKAVRNNTTIKIMLTESKVIGGINYESGDVIGAKTHIQGDRLILSVDGYIKNDVFMPITAQVMDLDGLLGLKVSIDAENEMQKNAWGQNASSTLGSVNPLLVYNPQGNLGQTVGNQVVGSLVNQSLNGANQYVNAKIRDVKVTIKTGQQLYLLLKN